MAGGFTVWHALVLALVALMLWGAWATVRAVWRRSVRRRVVVEVERMRSGDPGGSGR